MTDSLARFVADEPVVVLKKPALPPPAEGQDVGRSYFHVLVDGICTNCAPMLERKFNPSEPRIPGGEHGGEWGHGGAGGAVKDALKLAGRIQLNDGETFKGSTKMDGRAGTIALAWTEHGGQRHLRLGMLGEHDSDWHAADDGSSAAFDEHGIEALKTSLRDMQTKGVQAVKDFKDVNREMDAIEAKHGADESKWAPTVTAQYADLLGEYRRLTGDAAPTHGNTIYGSGFGQVRIGVAVNEGTPSEYDTWLVPQRRGAEEPGHLALAAQDGDGLSLTKVQLAKLLKLLDGPSEAGAAARSFNPNEQVGHPHVLRNGICTTCEVQRRFDPSEPRIPGGPHGGEWGHGGSAGKALKDAMKLDGKIDLGPDEKLVGSAKVDGDQAGIRMALTETHGVKSLRLGAGGEFYGQRNREEGIPAWDGNPTPAALSKAERERLSAEDDALDEEADTATPARLDEIDARKADIREQLTAGDGEFNGTAKLDEYSMGRLVARIRPALDEAVDQEKAENKAYAEYEALIAKGNPDPARIAELRRIARADSNEGITFTKGIIPGTEWGDVHYSVELDDPTVGAYITLGVTPKGAPDDWGDGKDWLGQFDAAETRKFLRLLDSFAAAPSS